MIADPPLLSGGDHLIVITSLLISAACGLPGFPGTSGNNKIGFNIIYYLSSQMGDKLKSN